jgi:DNA-binding MarR family transcriptional regulator
MKNLLGASPRPTPNTSGAGQLLRRLVDRVSHRTHAVTQLMDEGGVTLRQVLLIDRVASLESAPLSELVRDSHASAAALSQMVDRLVREGFLVRSEDAVDRRRKAVRVTPRAQALLRRLESARSKDYELGLAALSAAARERLVSALERALVDLERAPAGQPPSAVTLSL